MWSGIGWRDKTSILYLNSGSPSSVKFVSLVANIYKYTDFYFKHVSAFKTYDGNKKNLNLDII